MRKDRQDSYRTLALGGVVLAVLAAAAGFWFVQGDAGSERPDAQDGVTIKAPAIWANNSVLPDAAMQAPVAKPPASPIEVMTHVRKAYPLLRDVDFICNAGGCAITATIPPPTGDEFLKQRQEMLLGGLAKLAAADGYRMIGQVQMDEVDFNLFHIRASVAPAQ